MLQHVSILKRGSLKCGGEHHFKKKNSGNASVA